MSDTNLPVAVPKENGLGTVTFNDEVIAIIARIAAVEIPGVADMSGTMASGITEALGRKNLTKGVKVEVGNEQAAIDLAMIMDYGVRIPEVSRAVQENVKKAIETMTGLIVVEVNIHIAGVRFEKEAPAPKEVAVEPAKEPRVR